MGGGCRSAKHEAQVQLLNMLHTLMSRKKVRNKDEKERLTVTQGGTQTCDLANGLANCLCDTVSTCKIRKCKVHAKHYRIMVFRPNSLMLLSACFSGSKIWQSLLISY